MGQPFTHSTYIIYNNDEEDEGAHLVVRIDKDTGELVEITTVDDNSSRWFGAGRLVFTKEVACEIANALTMLYEEE